MSVEAGVPEIVDETVSLPEPFHDVEKEASSAEQAAKIDGKKEASSGYGEGKQPRSSASCSYTEIVNRKDNVKGWFIAFCTSTTLCWMGTQEASAAAHKEALLPPLAEEGGSDNDRVQSSSDDDDLDITPPVDQGRNTD